MSAAPVLAQLYSSSTQKWPFVSVYLVYVFNICSPAKQSFFARGGGGWVSHILAAIR